MHRSCWAFQDLIQHCATSDLGLCLLWFRTAPPLIQLAAAGHHRKGVVMTGQQPLVRLGTPLSRRAHLLWFIAALAAEGHHSEGGDGDAAHAAKLLLALAREARHLVVLVGRTARARACKQSGRAALVGQAAHARACKGAGSPGRVHSSWTEAHPSKWAALDGWAAHA